MAEPTGLRERNKRERRRRLEDVALDLFEREGFDRTTIEQIAAAAGIATRTFFSYFASKDDLVLADYSDRLARILDQLERRPAAEPSWDALRASFAAVAADYESEAEHIRRRFAIMASSPSVFARSLQLQAGWEQALTERLRTRLHTGTDDPTPRLFAATALAVMRASLQHWLTTPHAPALPELVQQGFQRLATGLA
ncbi:MAG: TetR family transcriptional regulator [Acidimicrobiales bacterium]|nr:TetR family transcriptional regulator [Acidimicrobiales bacterium]